MKVTFSLLLLMLTGCTSHIKHSKTVYVPKPTEQLEVLQVRHTKVTSMGVVTGTLGCPLLILGMHPAAGITLCLSSLLLNTYGVLLDKEMVQQIQK